MFLNDYIVSTGKKYPNFKYMLNACDFLKFPDCNYINLLLVYSNTFTIIDRINDKIGELVNYYEITARSYDNISEEELVKKSTSITLYYINSEELIYWSRKLVDQFITLVYIMKFYYNNNKMPINIDIDSIGNYMSDKNTNYKDFEEFMDFFENLNNISNFYKHSAYNANLLIFGANEPCISAYGKLGKNKYKLDNSVEVYNISLKNGLVSPLNNFIKKAKGLLSIYCEINVH